MQKIGAPGWDRTSNPCLRRAVLYPLSYGREKKDRMNDIFRGLALYVIWIGLTQNRPGCVVPPCRTYLCTVYVGTPCQDNFA